VSFRLSVCLSVSPVLDKPRSEHVAASERLAQRYLTPYKTTLSLTTEQIIKLKNNMHSRRVDKVFLYSFLSVWPRADPEYRQSTRRWLSHPPGSTLRLLSAIPAVTFPAEERHRSMCFGRYQIILLGDRGTCMWAACPRLLSGNGPAEIRNRDLLGHEQTLHRYATHATTTEYTCAKK